MIIMIWDVVMGVIKCIVSFIIPARDIQFINHKRISLKNYTVLCLGSATNYYFTTNIIRFPSKCLLTFSLLIFY